ncbi:hypothetical protein FHY55_01240 [Oceanicola sp. D3]|uniref:hypothetical protein n=1 Tax=Oceanicola sp. D3 TaxID=2587163 RepID=UPI00111F39D0|nr:hypothetical protein [Oceanicola sp. D3]QDC07950.1 hypothetical protein FHY55_01240 [Oceanicola sp. D3]
MGEIVGSTDAIRTGAAGACDWLSVWLGAGELFWSAEERGWSDALVGAAALALFSAWRSANWSAIGPRFCIRKPVPSAMANTDAAVITRFFCFASMIIIPSDTP